MPVTLRDYQQKQHNEAWSNDWDSPLIVAPTATGKGSHQAYELARAIALGKKVLVICPTDYLVWNIVDRFISEYPDCKNYISSDWGKKAKYNTPIMVGHFATIVNRLSKFDPDMIFIDEAHISACPSVTTIINYYQTRVMGWTATPRRLGGEPLSMYSRIVPTMPHRRFIDEGWIADYELETTADPEITELMEGSINDMLGLQQDLRDQKNTIANTSELWANFAYGAKTIIFCTGQDHGLHLQEKFNSDFAKDGFIFEYVDQKTPTKKRLEATQKLREGHITGIINIQLLIMGVDVPDCKCVLYERATASLVNYMQMGGRSFRKKSYTTADEIAYANRLEARGYNPYSATILDPVGNAWNHGSFDFNHEWSLRGKERKDTQVFRCEACGMPLLSKTEVMKHGRHGVEVICHQCKTLNAFQCLPTTRQEIEKQHYEGVTVSLKTFKATPDEFRIKRMLTDQKISVQMKRREIIKSSLDLDKKRSALRYIGDSESLINLHLG